MILEVFSNHNDSVILRGWHLFLRKTFSRGRERKPHECNGIFPKFACADISIFVYSCICIHLQFFLYWFIRFLFISFLFFISLLSPACLILKGNLSFYFHQLQGSAGVKENIAEDRRFVKQTWNLWLAHYLSQALKWTQRKLWFSDNFITEMFEIK